MSFIGSIGNAISSVGNSVINLADKGKDIAGGVSQVAGATGAIVNEVKDDSSFSETMDLIKLTSEMGGLIADIAKPLAEMTVIVGEGISNIDSGLFGGSQAKIANQSLVLV